MTKNSGSDKIGYELGLEPRECGFESHLPEVIEVNLPSRGDY